MYGSAYHTDRKKALLEELYAMEPKQTSCNKPEDAVVLFLQYRNRRVESFFSLSLDNKNNIIRRHQITRGTVDQCAVYAPEVLRPALKCGASGIILGHNHPGGDPTPSCQDIQITDRIKQSIEAVGLRLLDHIIVARGGHYSFEEHGHLR